MNPFHRIVLLSIVGSILLQSCSLVEARAEEKTLTIPNVNLTSLGLSIPNLSSAFPFRIAGFNFNDTQQLANFIYATAATAIGALVIGYSIYLVIYALWIAIEPVKKKRSLADPYALFFNQPDQESSFFARALQSVDVPELAFSWLDIDSEPCRKRALCEFESLAAKNIFLRYVMEKLNAYAPPSLSRYADAMDYGLRHDNCHVPYSSCPHDLNALIKRPTTK